MSHDRSTPPTDWPGLEMSGLIKLTDELHGWVRNRQWEPA